jgi:hypothetical protein
MRHQFYGGRAGRDAARILGGMSGRKSSEPPAESGASQAERSLTFMIGAVGGVSLLAFVGLLIANFAGVRPDGSGIWPMLVLLPYVGFPITILLIVVLAVLNARRRAQQDRKDPR